MVTRVPTAALAAAGLIGGYAVAVASGSRPLGGLVLGAFGIGCVAVWINRDGLRTTVILTLTGLLSFALAHVVAMLIGGWAAVLVAAAVTAGACWQRSDSRRQLGETRDRGDAGRTRSPVAAHEHRLDSSRPGPREILVDAVPDVDRLGR
jgi:hypothetical protein